MVYLPILTAEGFNKKADKNCKLEQSVISQNGHTIHACTHVSSYARAHECHLSLLRRHIMLFSGQYGQLFNRFPTHTQKGCFIACLLKILTRESSMGMHLFVQGRVQAFEGKHELFLAYC